MITITIKGKQGTGKSQIADKLAELLQAEGRRVVIAREGVVGAIGSDWDVFILETNDVHSRYDPIVSGALDESARLRAELVRVLKQNTELKKIVSRSSELLLESADPFDQACALIRQATKIDENSDPKVAIDNT